MGGEEGSQETRKNLVRSPTNAAAAFPDVEALNKAPAVTVLKGVLVAQQSYSNQGTLFWVVYFIREPCTKKTGKRVPLGNQGFKGFSEASGCIYE